MNMARIESHPGLFGNPYMDTKSKTHEANPQKGFVVQINASENFGLGHCLSQRCERCVPHSALGASSQNAVDIQSEKSYFLRNCHHSQLEMAMRGGRREGAGRPRGATNKLTREVE